MKQSSSSSKLAQNISPIMVDLLIKNRIPPSQVGMNENDLDRLKIECKLDSLAIDETLSYNKGYSISLPLLIHPVDDRIQGRFWLILRSLFLISCLTYLVLRSHYLRKTYVNSIKYTIRVNTFRRLDLLKTFLDHYTTCPDVQVIQVVWSDQLNRAPIGLVCYFLYIYAISLQYAHSHSIICIHKLSFSLFNCRSFSLFLSHTLPPFLSSTPYLIPSVFICVSIKLLTLILSFSPPSILRPYSLTQFLFIFISLSFTHFLSNTYNRLA